MRMDAANVITVAQWRPTARQSSNTDTASAMTTIATPMFNFTSS